MHACMPIFYSIGASFRHRKTGRAHGEDKRGGEFLTRYPAEFADIYLPLELKSKGLSARSLTFKVGQLHDL